MSAWPNVDEALRQLPVVILCGGRGTRLRPTTDAIPKALVPLNGRPILEYVLEIYRSCGLHHFLLCIGYCGADIRRRYAQPPGQDTIEFSDAGEGASMLQRLWAVRDHMRPRVMVSYGDTVTRLDLPGMLAAHLRRQALATIAIAKIQNPFGLVTFDDGGWVTSFREKPWLHYYIGHFLLDGGALDYVRPEMLASPDGQGLVELFSALARDHHLAVFEHEGLQITFNTESERQQAEEELRRFYTLFEDPWQR